MIFPGPEKKTLHLTDPSVNRRTTNKALEELSFNYSFACNFQCDHCITLSGPSVREAMGVSRGIRFLEQASDAGIKVIVFGGGEPFLFVEELFQLVAFASSLGMFTSMVSNGFWGNTIPRAEAFLNKFQRAGLNTITLSTDRFHARYGRPSNIGRILTVACTLGLATGIKISRLRFDPWADELAGVLDPYCDALDELDVKPRGRGKQLRGQVPLHSLSSLRNRCGCTPMLLTPNGGLVFCCNVPVMDIDASVNPLLMGNLNHASMAQLMKRRDEDPVLARVAARGPATLFEALCRMGCDTGRLRKQRYGDACDLCFFILQDAEYVEKLRGEEKN